MVKSMTKTQIRPGEVALDFDPATQSDASIAFIGHIRSEWAPGRCPPNIRTAREQGTGAWIDLDPRYAPGVQGLKVGQQMVLIYWMDHARRDLIIQNPRHADGVRGTFSLRSPLRPNPLALSNVKITAINMTTGRIDIDAIDCFDGTPLVDMKPWVPTIDMPSETAAADR